MILAVTAIFVLLATYWFGFKEGFFSGLIHLLCVIAAGAVAFAFWEPLAYAMLDISALREWAFGVSLLLVFSLALFLFRLAANLLIPERLNVPPLADIIGGGATGLVSGILTIGIGLIGMGFLPIGNLGGGYTRSQNNFGQPAAKSTISPAVEATAKFYATLSQGAFSPLTTNRSLATAHPAIARHAWGLQRDTSNKGRIALTNAPGDMDLGTPYVGSFPQMGDEDYYVVPVTVRKSGFHRGSNFVLSASQAYLVGDASTKPATAFPVGWAEGGKNYRFDDVNAYATNVPGEQSVTMLLAYPMSQLGGQSPRYLMFKGIRLPLAAPSTELADLGGQAGGGTAEYDRSAPMIPATYARKGRKIGPVINKNSLGSGIQTTNNEISFADAADIPVRTQGAVNKSLRVERLYQLKGTTLLMVDVSRGKSPIDIWADARQAAGGSDAAIVLLDENGGTYSPIGWLWTKAAEKKINVMFDPRTGVNAVGDAPNLSAAGKDSLELIFQVPEGRKIVAILLGDTTVGRLDLSS